MYLNDMMLDSGALGRRILADPQVASSLAGKASTEAFPYHVVIPANVTPTATNGWQTNYLANCYYNMWSYTQPTINGYAEFTVTVAAGTYTLRTLFEKNPDRGIASISIDGGAALGTTIDMYAATRTLNNTSDITGIGLTSGRHTIRYTAASKNASATAYYLSFHGLSLTRTGA